VVVRNLVLGREVAVESHVHGPKVVVNELDRVAVLDRAVESQGQEVESRVQEVGRGQEVNVLDQDRAVVVANPVPALEVGAESQVHVRGVEVEDPGHAVAAVSPALAPEVAAVSPALAPEVAAVSLALAPEVVVANLVLALEVAAVDHVLALEVGAEDLEVVPGLDHEVAAENHALAPEVAAVSLVHALAVEALKLEVATTSLDQKADHVRIRAAKADLQLRRRGAVPC
jgi:hypothetical protein